MLSEFWQSSGIRLVADGIVAGFNCTFYKIASKQTKYQPKFKQIKIARTNFV